MKRLWMIGIVLLAVCEFVDAQDKPPTDCPLISVIEPEGETRPGATMKFTVSISPPVNPEKLSYNWITSDGVIIEGQGKPSITIQTDRTLAGTRMMETVEISGLRGGCNNSVTGSGDIQMIRHPIMFDEIFGKEKATIRIHLDKLAKEIHKFPEHQLYFA
jgi:hypothetical protein